MPEDSPTFLRQTVTAQPTAAVTGAYPQLRLRRNRTHGWTRRLVAETRLGIDDLIWPIFLRDESCVEAEIPSMPGVRRVSLAELSDAVGRAAELGIPAVALFPYVEPDKKTAACDEAVDPENLICRAVRKIKAETPNLGVICDVALDPFNALGHDGIVHGDRILNDETIDILCRQALVQAEAGCDLVAPSDMMDGRIGEIRRRLDVEGYQDVAICAYAAKYASAFYGPFREAIGSGAALKGDKQTYQMNPANSDEALREVALDLDEGADMVMVKPGMPYLDIIRRVKETFAVPTLAYQVSGEYAMIRGAGLQGWIDGDRAMMEALLSFKRAGADGIFTYFAIEAAERLRAG
ncbi:porphobilinogen synthase [Algihabitans albus]|uniref:porphobilinogen synthase n=1 Tax=Algihabitans albus TaxID=2164067 RepID=UPI000E5CBBB4|nr:porphobilinogen synthase [Algihabitans albus]